MVETCFFCVVFRRRAAPSGFAKGGLFICSESVVWSCASWVLSRGAALKRVSVSGVWVVAISVGMTECQTRHGAAACRWTAEPTPSPPSLR